MKRQGHKRQGQTFNFQFPGLQVNEKAEKAGSEKAKRQGQTFNFQFPQKGKEGRVKEGRVKGRQGQTFNFQFPQKGKEGRVKEGRVRLSIFNFPAFR